MAEYEDVKNFIQQTQAFRIVRDQKLDELDAIFDNGDMRAYNEAKEKLELWVHLEEMRLQNLFQKLNQK